MGMGADPNDFFGFFFTFAQKLRAPSAVLIVLSFFPEGHSSCFVFFEPVVRAEAWAFAALERRGIRYS
jgi:hypothetical protein